ncbi:MAG TPA: aconitate hydratase [Candidatus Polarisedimenticolia bacterium]|nr:aconitate hydratase [Candidatus Polarisedimenticolia bacterium]
MHHIDSTPEYVRSIYERMEKNLEVVRRRLNRPLTFAEKIVFGHLNDPQAADLEPGKSYLMLRPDRVAMQDATAQMALLQFVQAGKKRAAVPTTVHCDHLIQARAGASADLPAALRENSEVFEFLRAASAKFGIGFWQPGAGIIHQVVLENYAFPGGLMIGTDSHTPNAGGLGMAAVGVGGADAVDVMAGFPWEVLDPAIIGVRLTGEMSGWTAPKDIILKVLGILTVKGGTNRIIEYFGPGARTISCTGKATITNMGAELGATTSLFPFDDKMDAYLRATDRGALADLAKGTSRLLSADPEVEADPKRFFERVIEIDLSKLEPHLVGPHTPDLARPVSEMASAVREHDYPDPISVALIGSCTNSSYEDISRAADVALQARAHGVKMVVPLLVTPGSNQIFETIKRDRQMEAIESVGATVLANACGPCIGQWRRDEIKKGQRNTIVTSFNRNFPGRNDANPETLAFMGSPEITMAYGLSGKLSFNPLSDTLPGKDGPWKLAPPKKAPELPERGFIRSREGFVPPADDPERVELKVAKDSERLQLLQAFDPMVDADFVEMPLLLKTRGKTTTDHISPAGFWLRFRGHLDKISDNMFLGAVNAFNGERGKTNNVLSGERGVDVPKVARAYHAAGRKWVVVGDENYGEGSSREHAAMSPRYLGCAAIIARSFARIHESNLKKQGILPLVFADAADYDKVRETDRITLSNLSDLAPGVPVTAILHHEGGSLDTITLEHTLNNEQIAWFRAGSALNLLRRQDGASRDTPGPPPA